jgi:hypothetical protein
MRSRGLFFSISDDNHPRTIKNGASLRGAIRCEKKVRARLETADRFSYDCSFKSNACHFDVFMPFDFKGVRVSSSCTNLDDQSSNRERTIGGLLPSNESCHEHVRTSIYRDFVKVNDFVREDPVFVDETKHGDCVPDIQRISVLANNDNSLTEHFVPVFSQSFNWPISEEW